MRRYRSLSTSVLRACVNSRIICALFPRQAFEAGVELIKRQSEADDEAAYADLEAASPTFAALRARDALAAERVAAFVSPGGDA